MKLENFHYRLILRPHYVASIYHTIRILCPRDGKAGALLVPRCKRNFVSFPPSLCSYHPSPHPFSLLHPFSFTRYPFHISINNVTTLQGPALSVDEPLKSQVRDTIRETNYYFCACAEIDRSKKDERENGDVKGE